MEKTEPELALGCTRRSLMPRECRHTSGLRGRLAKSVAAAGASRTYRRAYPAASDLVGIYEDVGTRLNGDIERLLVRFSTSVSRGSAIFDGGSRHRANATEVGGIQSTRCRRCGQQPG